jgi:hypothetical protein
MPKVKRRRPQISRLDLELKVRRAAKAAARDRGTTVRALRVEWVDHDADRGAHGVISDRTRRE